MGLFFKIILINLKRDIKPGNILLVDKNKHDFRLKLIDFGISVKKKQNDSILTEKKGTV